MGQPEPDNDLLRRVLIERRPPLMSKRILACAFTSTVALVLVLDFERF